MRTFLMHLSIIELRTIHHRQVVEHLRPVSVSEVLILRWSSWRGTSHIPDRLQGWINLLFILHSYIRAYSQMSRLSLSALIHCLIELFLVRGFCIRYQCGDPSQHGGLALYHVIHANNNIASNLTMTIFQLYRTLRLALFNSANLSLLELYLLSLPLKHRKRCRIALKQSILALLSYPQSLPVLPGEILPD
jgi:hypothetical protein